MKRFTKVQTQEVRDLLMMVVPEPWSYMEDDDVIKARLERETMLQMLTQKMVTQTSGESRRVPPVLGILRDFKIDLVRKPEDAQAVVVDHPDCTDCTDSVTLLIHAAEAGDLPNGIVGVVQFTFDEVVGAS